MMAIELNECEEFFFSVISFAVGQWKRPCNTFHIIFFVFDFDFDFVFLFCFLACMFVGMYFNTSKAGIAKKNVL